MDGMGMGTENSLHVRRKEKWGQQRVRRKGQRASMCVLESKGRKNFREKRGPGSGGRICQCCHHDDSHVMS